MTNNEVLGPVVLVRWDGGGAVGGHAEVFQLSLVDGVFRATCVDDEWWVEEGSNFWLLLAALAGLNGVEATDPCHELVLTHDLTLL
jgi:hypothetical protein